MYSVGKYIKLKNSELFGKIIKIIQNKDSLKYVVKINNKNALISKNDIDKEIEYEENKAKNGVNIITNDTSFNNELMIRHLTQIEAETEIERFIDKALINNAKILKIIHGKSGGTLRRLTHEYLKNCKYVKDYRLGYPHEGSYGVTIVTLK